MGRIVTIHEFDAKKHPRIAQEFPDMRYHDALLQDKWNNLDRAIDDVRDESKNRRAKNFKINLKTKEGKTKTVFKRTDFE